MLAPHRARHMAVLKFSTSSSHRQYSHILKSYHDLFELNVIDPARHTRSLGSGPASRRAPRDNATRATRQGRRRHPTSTGQYTTRWPMHAHVSVACVSYSKHQSTDPVRRQQRSRTHEPDRELMHTYTPTKISNREMRETRAHSIAQKKTERKNVHLVYSATRRQVCRSSS